MPRWEIYKENWVYKCASNGYLRMQTYHKFKYPKIFVSYKILHAEGELVNQNLE